MVPDITGRVAINSVVSIFLSLHAAAQEGYYGVGHDRWHREFYSKLNRNDGGGTCCNLMDCRPTQSRMVGDHYEVKVDGEWTPVPNDRINQTGRCAFGACRPASRHRRAPAATRVHPSLRSRFAVRGRRLPRGARQARPQGFDGPTWQPL